MAVATHLGPWMLGTVKDTTGTTAGLIRNVGSTVSTQSKAVLYTDITAGTTAFTIPANGSVFTNTGTVALLLGNNNAAAAVLCNNVGTTDAIITFTQANVTATSGAGTLTLVYTVRNADGTYGAAS